MNWAAIDPDVFVLAAILAGLAAWASIGWWKGHKARRVLAGSLDHPIRPSEEMSLNAWMHVSDQQLDALAEGPTHTWLDPTRLPNPGGSDSEPDSWLALATRRGSRPSCWIRRVSMCVLRAEARGSVIRS